MQVRLLVRNDKANVKKVVLRSDTLIGRSSDCNLRIASKEVSRKHCSVLLSESQVRVRDLGSSNGTFLNGERLKANMDVPLPSGSELLVGNVTFLVQHNAPLPEDEPGSTVQGAKAAVSPQADAATQHREGGAAAVQQATNVGTNGAKSAAESSGVDATEQAALDTVSERAEETIGETPADEANGNDELDAEETVDIPSARAATDPTADETSEGLADTIAFDFSGTTAADEDAEARNEPSTDVHREVPAEPAGEDTSSAGATEDTDEGEDDAEAEADTGPGKASGLKSLFNFFRPKEKPKQERPATAQETEPAASEAADGFDEDDQTVYEDAEAEGFEPDEDPAEETVMDSAVEVEGAPPADEGNEGIEFSDEDEPAAEPSEPAAEHEESDDDLQDFLRNLSQE